MPNLTNLRKLLKERSKSEELSKNTEISSGNISDWKSGRSKPGLESLLKIAEYFECSVDYLLDRTDMKELVTNRLSNIIPIPILEQRAAAGLGIEINDYSEFIKEYRFMKKNIE